MRRVNTRDKIQSPPFATIKRVAQPILHTEISGSGPVLVMLHGYLASSRYYKKLAPRLARDYTVVRLDLLGHGRSPKPRRSSYGFDEQIAAIRHTLERLGIATPYSFVGHSMGTLIALRYATRYPEDVSRLVLFNPPMFSSPEEARADIAASGRHYRAFLFSRFRRSIWRTIKVLPRSPRRVRPAVSLSDILAVPYQARDGSLRNIVMQGNIFQEVELVNRPILVAVGQRDRRIYIKNAMRHTWPAHVTLKVNEYGHNGMASHPELAEHYIRLLAED